MLKLTLQYFGHLMQTADLLEKSLMLGKIKGRKPMAVSFQCMTKFTTNKKKKIAKKKKKEGIRG